MSALDQARAQSGDGLLSQIVATKRQLIQLRQRATSQRRGYRLTPGRADAIVSEQQAVKIDHAAVEERLHHEAKALVADEVVLQPQILNDAAESRALRERRCERNEAIVADAIAEKSKVPQESKHAQPAAVPSG